MPLTACDDFCKFTWYRVQQTSQPNVEVTPHLEDFHMAAVPQHILLVSRLAYSIDEMAVALGIGRTFAYTLVNEGTGSVGPRWRPAADQCQDAGKAARRTRAASSCAATAGVGRFSDFPR
jgi:hypothetical protein